LDIIDKAYKQPEDDRLAEKYWDILSLLKNVQEINSRSEFIRGREENSSKIQQ